MLTALISAAIQDAPDPLLLPIGTPGEVQVSAGWTDTATGKPAGLGEIAAAASDVRFVLVGESHDQLGHHKAQADVIQALVDTGRDVTVGFEMFTRDNQGSLGGWTLGRWTEEEFIEKSSWETQWGFEYAVYKPIFDVVKRNRLPMKALNLPRDWVRQIGREGPGVLDAVQRKWAPDIYLGNKNHKSIFTAMMGGHPMTGTRGDNIYAAQVSWDEGMAQSAVDFMAERTHSKAVMVIVVGSGHVIYGESIAYRLKRKGQDSLVTTCINADGPRLVSRGLASYVYSTPRAQSSSGQ
jgi:uncharacterized iron-regulated protein